MGVVEDQAALAAEAYRRANPYGEIPAGSPPEGASTGAGLQIGDTWSSGGEMPGMTTPDLQGPTRALGYPDHTVLPPNERPINPIPGEDK
jgi:hypothetical protein